MAYTLVLFFSALRPLFTSAIFLLRARDASSLHPYTSVRFCSSLDALLMCRICFRRIRTQRYWWKYAQHHKPLLFLVVEYRISVTFTPAFLTLALVIRPHEANDCVMLHLWESARGFVKLCSSSVVSSLVPSCMEFIHPYLRSL